MKHSVYLLSFALAGVALGQSANLNAKPGLWETTVTSTMSGMPQMDTSKIPPEVLKQMQERMSKNQAPRTSTTRSCQTKEKLEKEMFMSPEQQAPSCKRTIVTNTKSTLEVKFECATDKATTSGVYHLDAVSPESVRGTMKATGTLNINATISAKWISDSCGDVK